ncbi:MAG: methyltransferase domain-containing protein [Pseudomonadota bacterium]
MTTESTVAHYARGDLMAQIERAVASTGKRPETLTIDDLGALDEFHIGARAATVRMQEQLAFDAGSEVVDVGCGLGGPARYFAQAAGARVTGVDLTPEFVDAGTTLTRWVGLQGQVTLMHQDAMQLPFPDGSFNGAYMFHVGMNIADKASLLVEVARVLRPGARFGIYDIMRVGSGEICYPAPWSRSPETSFVATPDQYVEALRTADFETLKPVNRRDFAREFFAATRAAAAEAGGPPALGLQLVLGPEAGTRLGNMVYGVMQGIIAPVEIIATRQ